ncbi:hypothetical protein VTI74DRAFT_3686 [Chaetomium olivicolor]
MTIARSTILVADCAVEHRVHDCLLVNYLYTARPVFCHDSNFDIFARKVEMRSRHHRGFQVRRRPRTDCSYAKQAGLLFGCFLTSQGRPGCWCRTHGSAKTRPIKKQPCSH